MNLYYIMNNYISPKVKRITGILYPVDNEKLLQWSIEELTKLWGTPEIISEAVPFDKTNYYDALYNYNTAKANLDKAMGIPVGIDVTRYISAEADGKSAAKAREEAALNSKAGEEPKLAEVAPVVTIDLANAKPIETK